MGIDINVNVPPIDGGGGGGGSIVDGRFDGAFLGGFSVSHRFWRIDADGLWAAVGGDRPQNPKLTVEVDAVYFHATGGVKVYKDLYVTRGVRRYALKYNVKLADYAPFERKPGVWDPVVGMGWHYAGKKFEAHATFDGGGFGVGADVDIAAGFHVDWKPVRFFGRWPTPWRRVGRCRLTTPDDGGNRRRRSRVAPGAGARRVCPRGRAHRRPAAGGTPALLAPARRPTARLRDPLRRRLRPGARP